MDDYHAFTSTTDGGGGGSGPGCSSGCLPWIIGGLVVLYLIGEIYSIGKSKSLCVENAYLQCAFRRIVIAFGVFIDNWQLI